MEHYPIISIDNKYYNYPKSFFLKLLKTYDGCDKIPLTTFNSHKFRKTTIMEISKLKKTLMNYISSNIPKFKFIKINISNGNLYCLD